MIEVDSHFDTSAKIRDMVTGFEGTCIAITKYMNLCVRACIQPNSLDKDGKPAESQWFDVEQCEVIEPKQIELKKEKRTGGPARQVSPERPKPDRL